MKKPKAIVEGEEFLEHYGVKGMRWGVRRKNIGEPTEVVVSTNGSKIATSGGKNLPPSGDAIKSAKLRRAKRESGTNALSNEDLQFLQNRLNLERNISKLTENDISLGKKFMRTITSKEGQKDIEQILDFARTADKAAKQKKAGGQSASEKKPKKNPIGFA